MGRKGGFWVVASHGGDAPNTALQCSSREGGKDGILSGLQLRLKIKKRQRQFNGSQGLFAEVWKVYDIVDNSMQILMLNKALVGYQMTIATDTVLNS